MSFRSPFSWALLAAFALALGAGAAVFQQDDLPKEEDALWQYAMNQYNSGNWQKGDPAFQRYIELFPTGKNIEMAYYYRGYLHMYYSRRYDEARKAFQALADKFPKGQHYWQARFAVAQVYQYQGLNAKAIETYEKIVEEATDSNWKTSAIYQIWSLKGKYFYLNVNQTFTVGQKPVVHAQLCNVDKVDYKITRVKYDHVLEHLKPGDQNNLGAAIAKVGKEGREELKKWTENHNVGPQKWEQKNIEIPASESGIYIVDATHERITMTVTVFVSKYGIITKSAGGKLLVFAQDRASSKPVSGMTIKVLAEKTVSGSTNGEGLFLSDEFKGGTVIGLMDGELVTTNPYYYSHNQQHPVNYVYTDRPIYRPNQTVHFKVVHRTESGKKLDFKPGAPAWIDIRDPKGNLVYKGKHELNEFGTTHGKFVLGDEPALGHYMIHVRYTEKGDPEYYYDYWGTYGPNHGQFRVDEYRKPEYKVDVAFARPYVIQGDAVEATITATYYFGAPVANATVNYRISRRHYWYWWRCWEWYYDWYADEEEDEGHWRWRGYGEEQVTQGTGTTDKDGRLVVRFTPQKQDWDMTYSVSASVTDLSRRAVDGGGTVKATRAEFGLATSLNKWVYKPGERINLRVRAAKPDDTVVSGQKLKIRGYSVEWKKDKNHETKFYEADTATDEHGVADVTFTPDLAGGYIKLQAEATDRLGNRVTADAWVWLWSETWWGDVQNFNGLDIILDKKTYDQGETAKVLITSQFKNVTVLLTLEGKEVYQHQVVTIKGQTKLVEIKLDNPDLAPNFYVSVTAIKENALVQKYKSVIVNPSNKFVTVKVTADKSEYRPRDKAVYRVETTDSAGKPVSAEVSLGIVDESIYALQPEFAQDIRKQFVHKRWYEVATSTSLYYWDWGRGDLADKEEAPASAGARAPKDGKARESAKKSLDKADRNESDDEAMADTEVRSNFADTMHWIADVTTDSSGRAEIAVTLPDNLTTWRATARAVTKDHRFGQATSTALCRKDVIVRLELPRFFTQGDVTLVTAVAHNYLKSEKKMKIVLEVEGIEVQGEKEQTFQIEPEGQKRFDWKTKIDGAGLAKITVKALTNEASDAMQLVIPILPHGSMKWESKTGFVEGKVTEKIVLPKEAIAQSSELVIVVSPTHASTVLDALDYLAGYPYGCVEQTMSRFLPTVIVARTLQKLGIDKPGLQEELPKMVAQGLQRLYNFQQQDGGWGWWQNDKSNPWTTAYVLFGLALAREADMPVDENVMARGIAAAHNHLKAKDADENTQAYLLYALHAAGQKVHVKLDDAKLNDYAKALCALVLHKQGKKEEAERMLALLTETVKETGSTAYWEGSGRYGWLDHAVEITAVALRAWIAVDPKSKMIPKMVNWLASVREGNYWASTKQTAMVVFAMTDYLALTGELNPDMTVSLSLNGDRVFSERVTKENWQKFNGTRTFKAHQFNAGANEITIEREGTGTPIYSIFLRYYAKQEVFEASKGGIQIDRTYGKVTWDGNKRIVESLADGATVKSGDEIEVTIRVRGDKNYEWLMLECPMPAGFEAVREYWGYYGWYWNYWYSHKEFRDEKMCAAMSRLWTNHENVIQYTMRAEVPGDYHVLPAVAYNMYFPQIGGNSAEFRIKVVD